MSCYMELLQVHQAVLLLLHNLQGAVFVYGGPPLHPLEPLFSLSHDELVTCDLVFLDVNTF